MSEIATVWQPNPFQEGEFSQSTAVAIVDPLAVALVDPSAVAIFDTGQLFTQSSTVWFNDPGA